MKRWKQIVAHRDRRRHESETGRENARTLAQIRQLRQEYRARRVVRTENADSVRRVGDWLATADFWLVDNKSALARLLFIDFLVDFIVCVLVLVEVELWQSYDQRWYLIMRPAWLYLAFYVLSLCNLFSLLIRTIFVARRSLTLFSWVTLLDCITVLPFLITPALPHGFSHLYLPMFLRVWVAFSRFCSFLNLRVEINQPGSFLNQMTNQIIQLLFKIVAFFYTWMNAFHLLEATQHTIYTTIDLAYYTVISAATVGYGDIVPKNQFSKLLTIAMTILALSFLPLITGILETYRNQKDNYKTVVSKQQPFVVIALSYTRDQFLKDLLSSSLHALTAKQTLIVKNPNTTTGIGTTLATSFTPDSLLSTSRAPHEVSIPLTALLSSSYHIVILTPTPPSPAMKIMLSSIKFHTRVTFIQGSALEENDLRRAKVRQAAACFIIADRHRSITVPDAIDEDHKNVLRVWSTRKYAPTTPVYVYNLRPETAIHVGPLSRQVVCVNSIKQMILACSTLHRGTVTLIANLVHHAPPLKSYERAWQSVYTDGIGNSVRFAPFNPLFSGKTFADVAWYLYAEFQVILIGLRLRVPASIDAHKAKIKRPHATHPTPDTSPQQTIFTYKSHIVLNPGPKYIIPTFHLAHELIFISQSFEDIADIECLTPHQFHETWFKWHNVYVREEEPVLSLVSRLFPGSEERHVGCECIKAFGRDRRKVDEEMTAAKRETVVVAAAPPPNIKMMKETTVSEGQNSSGESVEASMESVASDGNITAPEDAYETDAAGDDEPVDGSPRQDQSRFFGGLSAHDMFIGHPRPPHHMVIDNDLQSPFCHMLKTPMKLEEARLLDASRDRSELTHPPTRVGHFTRFRDHVIACCDTYEIWAFLCAIRASHIPLEAIKPVVILCRREPTEEEWRGLSVFPFVYFLVGDVLRRNDIMRAGLNHASCVVMMKPSGSTSGSDERFVDSTAIMATHQIDFMMRNKYVVTELSTRNNIKFMRAKHDMLDSLPIMVHHLPPNVQPIDITHMYRRFAYRNTLPSGALANQNIRQGQEYETTRPSEKYHEETVWDDQEAEAVPDLQPEIGINTEDPGYYAHSAIFASGRVLPGDMLDGLIFEEFRTPGIVDIVNLLCGGRYQRWVDFNQHMGITASIMCTIPVPKQFIGQGFSKLFAHLALLHGCVPIAIYRRRTCYNTTVDDGGPGVASLLAESPTSITGTVPPLTVKNNDAVHSLSFHRTLTDASNSSVHLFNLDNNQYSVRSDPGQREEAGSPRNQQTERLARLLNDSNRVDNDLPFVLTNPLPDFILDRMDQVFILKPEAGL